MKKRIGNIIHFCIVCQDCFYLQRSQSYRVYITSLLVPTTMAQANFWGALYRRPSV